jgi:anti-anti-sigma factor
MDIHHEKKGVITIITINGRLDGATAPVAEGAITNILIEGCTQLVFDFSELDYISSVGLRTLILTAKKLKQKEGKIVLCSMVDHVKEIFEISGFDSFIPISDTVEQGIKHLR